MAGNGITHNVATKVASVVTTAQNHIAGHELSLFAMSDQKILEQIYGTHVHADESFDDDSLFVIVENILKRATQIVDKIVQVYTILCYQIVNHCNFNWHSNYLACEIIS